MNMNPLNYRSSTVPATRNLETKSNVFQNFSFLYSCRMRGGELLQRLSEKDYLTEYEITRYVKQILEGVKDMHEKNVLHLDLKVRVFVRIVCLGIFQAVKM